jgi:hypothetical protein
MIREHTFAAELQTTLVVLCPSAEALSEHGRVTAGLVILVLRCPTTPGHQWYMLHVLHVPCTFERARACDCWSGHTSVEMPYHPWAPMVHVTCVACTMYIVALPIIATACNHATMLPKLQRACQPAYSACTCPFSLRVVVREGLHITPRPRPESQTAELRNLQPPETA